MTATVARDAARIGAVRARAYTIPAESPESDGTLEWRSTTLVYVEIDGGGVTGIGYTYADASAAALVRDMLSRVLVERDAFDIGARHVELHAAIRNNGRGGIAAMALSALDVALWDLKAKLLGLPLAVLLGRTRNAVDVYGSGGFTSYGVEELTQHMRRWVDRLGIPRVKMKIGRDPDADPQRVAAVRAAIGDRPELFVDANGAYAVKQAIGLASVFAQSGVTWFEEPVDHDDLDGNARVRAAVPAPMEVSNGEYGYTLDTFQRILSARAADVVQADVTRCGGVTGFMAVDALCDAANVPLSSHCAPYLTLPVALASKRLRHLEYFYDHVRIERMLFDGPAPPHDGRLTAYDRPGLGLELKSSDAERYAV